METKQKTTAVEWLQDKLLELEIKIDYKAHQETFFLFEQAKQMEKEQTIEFADKYGFDICHYDYDRAEQYYNETYKQ